MVKNYTESTNEVQEVTQQLDTSFMSLTFKKFYKLLLKYRAAED